LAVGIANFNGDAVGRLAVLIQLEILDPEGEVDGIAGQAAGLGTRGPEVTVGWPVIDEFELILAESREAQDEAGPANDRHGSPGVWETVVIFGAAPLRARKTTAFPSRSRPRGCSERKHRA